MFRCQQTECLSVIIEAEPASPNSDPQRQVAELFRCQTTSRFYPLFLETLVAGAAGVVQSLVGNGDLLLITAFSRDCQRLGCLEK